MSQETFAIAVVTAVVSINRCNEPLPFRLYPPPLLSFAPVLKRFHGHCGSRKRIAECHSLVDISPWSMAKPRRKANEFCTCVHLERGKLGISGASEIAAMLGLPERDSRWCTPWRDDVSYLCNISNIGGFGSKGWTFHGWILDACSMEALQEEFPEALPIRLEDL